jgi:hypothetical protein
MRDPVAEGVRLFKGGSAESQKEKRHTMNYYRFQVEQQTCSDCGWTGTGAETERGETFESLFEFHCPRCQVKMGICTYPTRQEAEEAWDLVPEGDRLQFALQDRLRDACDRHELQRAEQLPDVAEPSFKLVWDVEERDGFPKNWTVIRLGERELWSEPALYEDACRFERIAELLKERYGSAVADMKPTRESLLCLYGDSWAAPGRVAKARIGLGATPEEVEAR